MKRNKHSSRGALEVEHRFGAQAGFDKIIPWKTLLAVTSEGHCRRSPAGTFTALCFVYL